MTVLTPALYRTTLQETLRDQFGRLKSGAKQLAAIAEVSVRTAENWLDGHCLPQGLALVKLQANCDAVKQAVTEMERLARGGRP